MSAYNPFARQEEAYGPPRPAPGGIAGWVNGHIRGFKNRNNRSATGAYESSSGGRPTQPAFLDPDEAWDARVDREAGYGPYEEQELHTNPEYDGGSYRMNLAATPGLSPSGFGDKENQRGRVRSRSPGQTGDSLNAPGKRNPFDDDAEPSNVSLRGVSPRPIDTEAAEGSRDQGGSAENSPTERRSVFREDV